MKDTPALDASMPPMIWLQIDTAGDNEADRDEPMPEDALDNVTWCRDSIGGVEVEYVRADLVRALLGGLDTYWITLDEGKHAVEAVSFLTANA